MIKSISVKNLLTHSLTDSLTHAIRFMKKEFDIIGRSKIWFTFSAILIVVSIFSIGYFGLNLGIDFTGGSLLEVQYEADVTLDSVRSTLVDLDYEAVIQEGTQETFLIRTENITREEHDVILTGLEGLGALEEMRFEAIGPIIGEELRRKSVTAVILLLVLIVLYVAWAFRKVSRPIASWKYGILTIVAAMHDVLVPLGVFAVLGSVVGYQIDTAFVAALLTILGYSINDSIVVFDRTRENLVSNRHSDASFAHIVNKSVIQSFARSINTSLTTLLVLLAIFFFGGETTRSFILALMIGIISGAYSSIFLASPLLVTWERKNRK